MSRVRVKSKRFDEYLVRMVDVVVDDGATRAFRQLRKTIVDIMS